MYEIEDAVEGAIRALDRSAEPLDHRSIYHCLYAFEETFGVGFTRSRVMEILVARRFTYRFGLDEHPDAPGCLAALTRLGGFGLVGEDPRALWDPVDNPVAGYIESGQLCCDLGSGLWRRFVECGVLAGDDAQEARPLELLEVVATVCEEASAARDLELMAQWHSLVEGKLHAGVEAMVGPQGIEDVKALPGACRIREVVLGAGALDGLEHGDELPPRQVIEESPVLSWWYGMA